MNNHYSLIFQQLNFIGHCYGLNVDETNDLRVQADIDGNGVLDYNEFKNLGGGKSRVISQLAHRFPSSDCTLLRTKSCPQSDCSIPNKIQPQAPIRIRTLTLPLETSLMLIVSPVELCPRGLLLLIAT
ncbi:Endo/exonuclease/phosphatase domain-containing protein [Forsythia ovata]|uniref:Endo/exonuclease/phosphatase domain-containing protein n=1 Tax=Forsythia ovata TaxID=205694 RepID=A0ABD1USC1_9LAMI